MASGSSGPGSRVEQETGTWYLLGGGKGRETGEGGEVVLPRYVPLDS